MAKPSKKSIQDTERAGTMGWEEIEGIWESIRINGSFTQFQRPGDLIVASMIIVVEGRTDAAFLRAVLPKADLAEVRFFASEGEMSLASLARNIAFHEGIATLVVMDAGSLDLKTAELARQYTGAAIRNVSGEIPVAVFAFVPEIEVAFFESPEALSRLFGDSLTRVDRDEGLIVPKRTLGSLMKRAGLGEHISILLERIDDSLADALRRGKQMAAFMEVFESIRSEVMTDLPRR